MGCWMAPLWERMLAMRRMMDLGNEDGEKKVDAFRGTLCRKG